jgi:hypothetical protein
VLQKVDESTWSNAWFNLVELAFGKLQGLLELIARMLRRLLHDFFSMLGPRAFSMLLNFEKLDVM